MLVQYGWDQESTYQYNRKNGAISSKTVVSFTQTLQLILLEPPHQICAIARPLDRVCLLFLTRTLYTDTIVRIVLLEAE